VRAGVANLPPVSPAVKNGKVEEREKEKKEEESRQIEEIKLINEVPNHPLASLENCTLDEVISVLQNYACDPTTTVNQAGFDSYIANHIIKRSLIGMIKNPWFHLILGMCGNQGSMSL
jgi:hypothetical protein